MASPRKIYFSRVREAREALSERALDLHDLHMKIIEQALATGDLEVAAKTVQWLESHMPSEEGVTMIDSDIDQPKQVESGKGPQINIGFSIGGITPKTPELPPSTESTVRTIEVLSTAEKPDDDL